MDEPLGAIDRRLREELQYEIRRIHYDLGVTVLYVTHDQNEAMVMSDRVAVLRAGRIEQIASPEVLYEEPERSFVARFIGENNRLVGRIVTVSDDICDVDVGGQIVRALHVVPCGPGDATTLSIRPERVSIAPTPGLYTNEFDARIEDIIFLATTSAFASPYAAGRICRQDSERGRRRAHEAGMNMTASEPRFRIGRVVYLAVCGLIFTFLLAPLLVIVPLSFNAEPYFTFTEGMLRLDPEAYSLRWYRQITGDDVWTRALGNSLLIGVTATALATALGTLAALGLSSRAMPTRRLVTGLLISPMVTPLIISATGMFFFYSTLGLSQTHLGLILAHAALGTPFVVITVTATLSSFDTNLTRAAASLGAGPFRTFRRVQLPLIAPGVLSGAIFAFAASFDEVVVVLFMAGEEQRTIPRQMWAGIREQISPAILAVATFLIVFAVLLLCTVEWLGRRGGGSARA